MNFIDSQTFSEAPTVILGSQSSLPDKDSQISASALAALGGQPSLKRSLSAASDLSSESLFSKRVRMVPSKEDSNEEISAYLKLDTWRCEKNREEIVSTLVNCFKEQRIDLALPDLGYAQLPNCLEKMTWVKSLTLQSTSQVGNFSVLTKLHNLKSLSLAGETQDPSFLREMPFVEELSISCNPVLKNLSFLKNSSNLIELSLDHNQNLKNLSAIKSLAKSSLKNLESLSLSGKFRDLSFLEALPFLKKLSVSSNPSLKNLSFLNHVSNLIELSLKNNKNLTTLSGIEPLIRLIKIDLSDTPIQKTSLLDDLPKLKYQTFYKHSPGLPAKKSTLGLLRANIEDEALQRINLRPFINYDKTIISWLKRLTNGERDTPMPAWNLPQTREALSRHVLEILRSAQQDPVFTKEILLPLINDSMTSCSDRTLYCLNEIIRQLELYTTKDLPVSKAIPVFAKYYRLFLVKELARASAERRNVLHEEIEVQLDFFQKLAIELPFLQTQYSHLYRASSQEIQEAASTLSQKLDHLLEWVRYLCLDPFWQKRLFAENPALKVEFERIEESKYEELEVILANSPNHPALLKELEIRHNQKIVEILSLFALQILENGALQKEKNPQDFSCGFFTESSKGVR
jgi:hypothetical protein